MVAPIAGLMVLFLSYPARTLWRTKRAFASSSSAFDTITSTKSKTLQKVSSLLKRKKRVEYCQTIVEGPRMVFDLLRSEKTIGLVEQILISTDKWDESSARVSEILQTSGQKIDIPVIPVAPNALKSCSDTVTPQGIVAVCNIPENYEWKASDRRHPMYLVVDGVSDPGNLGTLIRSSVATDVSGVLLLPESCDPWSPKALRSGMSATFQIPVQTCASWEECQRLLFNLGCTEESIWAATMLDSSGGSASTPHFNVDWVGTRGDDIMARALVIGSEGRGLSPAVRESSSIQTLHVPMHEGIESLNAGVCGSVILFDYMRQCRIREQESS